MQKQHETARRTLRCGGCKAKVTTFYGPKIYIFVVMFFKLIFSICCSRTKIVLFFLQLDKKVKARAVHYGWLLLAPPGWSPVAGSTMGSRRWQRRFFVLYELGKRLQKLIISDKVITIFNNLFQYN